MYSINCKIGFRQGQRKVQMTMILCCILASGSLILLPIINECQSLQQRNNGVERKEMPRENETLSQSWVRQPPRTTAVPNATATSSVPPIKLDPYMYDDNSNDPRPRNLRLAFIGDSISRYQYISLVYFLKTGQWITEENMKPQNPLYLHTYGVDARNTFFQESNKLLLPLEECDCHDFNENRYFADPERGNYITYIIKFGKSGTNGHWQPHEVHANRNATSKNKTNILYGSDNSNQEASVQIQWSYSTWNATISQHIAKLLPTPDFVIFNAGLHNHDLDDVQVQHGILEATLQNNIIPIYKTTTYPNHSMPVGSFDKASHDNALCGNAFRYCIDLSWTATLGGYKDYYDIYHMKPQHNQRMNLQTLAYLQEIVSASQSSK
jgi:hypothetical protein